MGVNIRHHEKKENRLYVFGMNEVGEKFTIIFERLNKNTYEFEYALLPGNEWNGSVFQDVIDIRDAANEYIENKLDFNIEKHPISLEEQFIPKKYWDDVDIDRELVESTDIKPSI